MPLRLLSRFLRVRLGCVHRGRVRLVAAGQFHCAGHGRPPIAYDPMLDYWLRMICGAFTLVGVWYLALALWPRKFAVAIPWFGWLMIVEGVILLVSGLRLGIGPFPFYGDVSACFLGGAGILVFARAAKS